MFGEPIEVTCECGHMIEEDLFLSGGHTKCPKCSNEIRYWTEQRNVSKKRKRVEMVTVFMCLGGTVKYSSRYIS